MRTKQSNGGQSDQQKRRKETSAQRIAREHGVSEKTVRRNAEFTHAVDAMPPEERAAVLQGRDPRTIGQIVCDWKLAKGRAVRKAPDPVYVALRTLERKVDENATRLGNKETAVDKAEELRNVLAAWRALYEAFVAISGEENGIMP